MKNKMNLVVVEQNGSGGLIHYAYQLCTALADQNIDVTLITGKNYELIDFPHNFRVENTLDLWPLFEPSISEAHETALQKKWRKLKWTIRRGVRAVLLIRAWIKLTRLLLKIKPDIVQFSKINFPFETFFLNYLQKKGLTLSQVCHEFELRENQGVLSSLILRLYSDVYKHFSIMFFHAIENQKRFLKLFPFVLEKQTYIIPHGNSDWLLKVKSDAVNILREKYRLQEKEHVILFFGLLAPSKGLNDLIEAFALIKKTCEAKLVIAGYPTKYIDMTELHSKVLQHNLEGHVIFDERYIPLEQIRPLMELATVVIYPYHSSTQSGALQTAYTFGKPVVATRVGGLPEAIDEGSNGFLINPRSPRELSQKMMLLLNNSKLAKEMGEHARYLANTKFSWRNVAEQIKMVYAQKLNFKFDIVIDDND